MYASRVLLGDRRGGRRRVLYQGGNKIPFYLYWNPRGDSLSFLSNSLTAPEKLDLISVSLSNGGYQVIDTGRPFYWDWSPDGESLALHTGGAWSQDSSEALIFNMNCLIPQCADLAGPADQAGKFDHIGIIPKK